MDRDGLGYGRSLDVAAHNVCQGDLVVSIAETFRGNGGGGDHTPDSKLSNLLHAVVGP